MNFINDYNKSNIKVNRDVIFRDEKSNTKTNASPKSVKNLSKAKQKCEVRKVTIRADAFPSVTHVTETSNCMSKITTDFPHIVGCSDAASATKLENDDMTALASVSEALPKLNQLQPIVSNAPRASRGIATVSGVAVVEPTASITQETALRKPKRRGRRPSPPQRR